MKYMHDGSEHIFIQIDSSVTEKSNEQHSVVLSFRENESDIWKIWEQLHKSRALEITTQWQRSVFLSAFITLLLTGHAFFFYHFVLVNRIAAIAMKHCLTGMAISLLLVIAAILWFAMTKGSKYWTNHYERKIDLIEQHLFIYQKYAQFRYLQEKFTSVNNQISVDEKLYKFGEHLVPDLSSWKLKADKVSPSKVNIFIGYLICAIGIVSVFIYFILLEIKFHLLNWDLCFCTKNAFAAFVSILLIFLTFVCIPVVYNHLKH